MLVFVSVKAQQNLNVVFIGNSITFGALHKNPTLTAPPVKCAEWLAKQPGIDNAWYVNMGKSGKTTFNFVPARTGIKNYWKEMKNKTAALVKEHPGAKLVFSIMLGTNDAAERPGNSRTTTFMYHHNMKLIIDSLQAIYPQAIFVLNKPIFFSAPYTTRNGSILKEDAMKVLAAYYKECCKLAKEYAKTNPGHVFAGDKDAFGFFKKNYKTMLNHEKGYKGCDFWLHPNEQGAVILAEYWGKAIMKVIH